MASIQTYLQRTTQHSSHQTAANLSTIRRAANLLYQRVPNSSMAPVGNPSLFVRFFGLVENYPLYAMLGIACGLATYMPFRHLTSDAELATLPSMRNHSDNLASSQRFLEKAKTYEGGVLGMASKVSNYPHVLPDVGVGSRPQYGHWAKPTTIPQPQ